MLQRKVQQIHKTLTVSLPRQFCDMVGIEKGSVIRIEIEKDKIIMSPIFASRQAMTNTGVVVQPMEAAHHE